MWRCSTWGRAAAKVLQHLIKPGIPVIFPLNKLQLTFTHWTDTSPGAVVAANPRGRADEMVALGASEMDLMSDKILWAKLCSMSRGFQGGAGGGSCGRKKQSTRGRLVTCGISLPTSCGILCLGIYTCRWAFMGNYGSNAAFTVNQHRTGHLMAPNCTGRHKWF